MTHKLDNPIHFVNNKVLQHVYFTMVENMEIAQGYWTFQTICSLGIEDFTFRTLTQGWFLSKGMSLT